MNIDDVTVDLDKSPEFNNIFPIIFKAQHDLMVKYAPIEQRNGFYYPDANQPPPHIDDPQFQSWIKNMFWRTTEELAEAVETLPDLTNDPFGRWTVDHNIRHFYEEVIDALHFFVEVSDLSGVTPGAVTDVFTKMWSNERLTNLSPTHNQVHTAIHQFIMTIGLAANTLKNKPWKSTHMQTDQRKFKTLMVKAWVDLLSFFVIISLDHERIWQLYFKKNRVNQFRQDSNY